MISEVAAPFPLCPGILFGKDAMKSTWRKRICNPLRNLSANPPRALKSLRFLRIARKPENVFPTGFPIFTFRACSVPGCDFLRMGATFLRKPHFSPCNADAETVYLSHGNGETQTGDRQMAYFSQITDSRRFEVEGRNEVFAVYDFRRSGHFLAPIGMDEVGRIVFVGEPEHFFDDEVREIMQ